MYSKPLVSVVSPPRKNWADSEKQNKRCQIVNSWNPVLSFAGFYTTIIKAVYFWKKKVESVRIIMFIYTANNNVDLAKCKELPWNYHTFRFCHILHSCSVTDEEITSQHTPFLTKPHAYIPSSPIIETSERKSYGNPGIFKEIQCICEKSLAENDLTQRKGGWLLCILYFPLSSTSYSPQSRYQRATYGAILTSTPFARNSSNVFFFFFFWYFKRLSVK